MPPATVVGANDDGVVRPARPPCRSPRRRRGRSAPATACRAGRRGRTAAAWAVPLEAPEVADGGRAVDAVAVVGGGGDEPAGEPAEDDVGLPPQPCPVAGFERVVGAVLAAHAQEGGVPLAVDPGVGGGPEVPVAVGRRRRSAGTVQARCPSAMCRAMTDSASGAALAKSQSAVSNTTSPRAGSTVPDDHTLPHPSSSTVPWASTSVWYSHTGLPVARLGRHHVAPVPRRRRRRRPRRAPCSSTTTGDEKMRVPSGVGIGGRSGRPV